MMTQGDQHINEFEADVQTLLEQGGAWRTYVRDDIAGRSEGRYIWGSQGHIIKYTTAALESLVAAAIVMDRMAHPRGGSDDS